MATEDHEGGRAVARSVRQPTDAEIQRSIQRYELAKWTLAPAIWLAACWIPLQAILPIAKVFAGKHTSVGITISISIAFSVVMGGSVVALLIRDSKRRQETERLRRRTEKLEKQLQTGPKPGGNGDATKKRAK